MKKVQIEIDNSAICNMNSTLPDGWRWGRLGEVCELIMGQSPPGSTYTDKPDGLPFFQGKADFGEYLPRVRVWCTQPIKIAEEGDILISVRAPVGPVNMNNLKCCIGRGLAAIRCKENMVNWFVFWYLRSIEEQLASLGSGSTFGAITRHDLMSLEILLPPVDEQKRIAAKVQELMQEVEHTLTACERQLEGAKTLPAAYLRDVFESEEAKKWERKKLGEVCEVIMGQSPPGSTYIDKPEGLPFFQGKTDFREYFPRVRVWCTRPIKIAEEGDILISVRAPVGPVNMSNSTCCIGRGLAAIRCKDSGINWFIFWYLRYIEARIASLGSGSTFGAIIRDDLESLQIPLPPKEEQKSIAAALKEKMAGVERLCTSIEKQLEAINVLPQAILRKAFRG